MPGKGEDRPEGLAEQSVNTSVVHPGQGGRGHAAQGEPSAGSRSLTGNDQREGLERTDPDPSEAGESRKP